VPMLVPVIVPVIVPMTVVKLNICNRCLLLLIRC